MAKQLDAQIKTPQQTNPEEIQDYIGCAGFNTNKFLKYFGGINKGRPNVQDLKIAEDFASKLPFY
jgi:hypothetical protein